ncbi:MAG TPA: ABC transporter ATP-binding protein, partial [Acidobacteriota bacterium]|nr:ABC transporter ATP-binding protein [Acidobacteriota bacterium]
MASVTFERVDKSFGTTPALRDISFEAGSGEFLVIVGPSGCGKSTLLRLVTGLESPDAGRILIDGVDVRGMPPKNRGCAMVFQSYALYPHWSVFDNIAFPLRIRRVPKGRIAERVRGIAGSLKLSAHLDKRPKALSGGERQRVALGRAIAADPQIFLFDEPLSNLDAPLRAGMRAEIVARQRELRRTALYVTHDQTEALTMGDRILVLDAGRIMGDGTPQDLYHDPPNRFVATFLGRPAINLVRGRLESINGTIRLEPPGWALPPSVTDRLGARTAGVVEIGVRPEHIVVQEGTGLSPWRVTAREFLGEKIQYTVVRADCTLIGFGPHE